MSRKKDSGLISKLKQKYPNITIVETSGYEESLQQISEGGVYYTIATLPVASHFISKLGLYNLSIIGYLDSTYNLSIATHKDKDQIIGIDIFSRILEKDKPLIIKNHMQGNLYAENTDRAQSFLLRYQLKKDEKIQMTKLFKN